MAHRVGEYEMGPTIGTGAYSKVKTVTHIPTKRQFVAKIVSKTYSNVQAEVRVEIAILRRVRHDNVVQLVEILESTNNYYIILEAVLGGDLCDLVMKARTGVPVAEARRLLGQLVSGISACHNQGVAHRDLKPENILVTRDGNLKISDFGLSRLHKASTHNALPNEYAKTVTGTLAYVAPEVLGGHYDAFKADIWSMGCILYVLATGRFPFGFAQGPTLEKMIKEGTPEPLSESLPAELRDLVRLMMSRDPTDRPSLPQIASHPFLKQETLPRVLPLAAEVSQEFERVDEVVSPGSVPVAAQPPVQPRVALKAALARPPPQL